MNETASNPLHSPPLSIREFMTEWVVRDIDLCIGCNRCMVACPVSKEHFNIGELNLATSQDTDVSPIIRDFAFNCVQCGRCVPVCPAGARRDYMVLFIKHKLRETKPSAYRDYLKIKGPFISGPGRLKQKVYASTQKLVNRGLAPFMETAVPTIYHPSPANWDHSSSPLPSSDHGGLLFYPGCYIYNTYLTRRQIRLLNHVGEPFSILGGLNTCCGVPQLLQGEFDLADRCLDSLHTKIMKARPKIIVTSCAECLEALLRIKAKHHEDFEVLTVLEYLMRHRDRFPEVKLRKKVTLHDSCRITRKYHLGQTPREALDRFCERVEMEESGQGTICCYYWNFGHDPANEEHRQDRIRSAQEVADVMVCDCISCYEKYEEYDRDGFEVLDVLQLFEEAIEKGAGNIESGGDAP